MNTKYYEKIKFMLCGCRNNNYNGLYTMFTYIFHRLYILKKITPSTQGCQ